jgi:signal transduction histidine kinase
VRLADFILRDMALILTQWEAFAATMLPAAARMTPLALRDHAREILVAVASDISTHQTKDAQAEKSMGRAPRLVDAPETAAQTHALLRVQSGFDINQLAAEYRALRASVLRLWVDACPPDATHLEDVVRFNEAIDQAVAESISFFSAQVDQSRDLLLGMIGHDMRSPLQTIQMTASYLAEMNVGRDVSQAASRLIRSGGRIKALLDDLVDFNRTRLGLGINIAPALVELATIFANELEQLRAAHPGRQLELKAAGGTRGFWDGLRLQQLLSNLVTNAITYGAQDAQVQVAVIGEPTEVRIEVRNVGPAIERSALERIFEPLDRGAGQGRRNDQGGSLGLGLFIAREIAKAHGGAIEARSSTAETVFVVRLPRHEGAQELRSAQESGLSA